MPRWPHPPSEQCEYVYGEADRRCPRPARRRARGVLCRQHNSALGQQARRVAESIANPPVRPPVVCTRCAGGAFDEPLCPRHRFYRAHQQRRRDLRIALIARAMARASQHEGQV